MRKVSIPVRIVLAVVIIAIAIGSIVFAFYYNRNNGIIEANNFNLLLPECFFSSGNMEITAIVSWEDEEIGVASRLPLTVTLRSAGKIRGEDEHNLMIMDMELVGESFSYKTDSYIVGGDYPRTYVLTNEGTDNLTNWKVTPGRLFIIDHTKLVDLSIIQEVEKHKTSKYYEITVDPVSFFEASGLDNVFRAVLGEMVEIQDDAMALAMKTTDVTYLCDKHGVLCGVDVSSFHYITDDLTARMTWHFDMESTDDVTDIIPSIEIVEDAQLTDIDSLFGTLEGQGYDPEISEEN